MTAVLFRKEWRQHGLWFLILGGLTLVIFLLVVQGVNQDGTGGGIFFGIGQALTYFFPIVVFILCHLLVAVEYRSKTQLFLEGLPLPRWKMVFVKAFIATLLVCAYTIGVVLIGWLASGGSEAVSLRFLGILISTAALFGWFVTSFFFLIAFLGRYRIPVLIIVFFIFNWLVSSTAVPVNDFPPFALIERFGFERDIWPREAMIWTAVIALLLFAVSFTLALAKEGSVSAILGEKMSYREKMFIGAAIAIGSMAIMMWETPTAEPFDIPGAISEERNGFHVYVSPEGEPETADLEVQLASYLVRELSEKRDWLGISEADFPPLYVVEKTGIEEDLIEWELVEGDTAILMYADYRNPEFHRETLMAWSMSQTLDSFSMGRNGLEHRWWIVCGYEGLWEMEDASPERVKAKEKLAFDTLEEFGFSTKQLIGRAQYADEAGWKEADAVIYMGFRYLTENFEMKTLQQFARNTINRPVTRRDGRAVWWDLTHPVGPEFEKTFGMTLDEFAGATIDYIRKHQPDDVNEKEESE
ncbi:ABC transporter permease [Verrucomicrobiales bacterium BCK34]|nr:ABC transporter permease [Verrucomicrobiales bacterium BCK34]